LKEDWDSCFWAAAAAANERTFLAFDITQKINQP